VNKVNSKATLRWPVRTSPSLPPEVLARFTAKFRSRLTNEGELVLTSQRYRDQRRNMDDCLEKLRVMVAEAAVRPIKRKATKPTLGSKQRRLDQKQGHARKKQLRRDVEE
jgi:ribosome-associated protein